MASKDDKDESSTKDLDKKLSDEIEKIFSDKAGQEDTIVRINNFKITS